MGGIPPITPGGCRDRVPSLYSEVPFDCRIIWIVLLLISEMNKTVDNTNVNKVKKRCLPPPRTFALHIVGGQYLVRSVHSIHILIVHCKDLRLSYLY